MKINEELRLVAARWLAPSAALLVGAIDRLCTKRKNGARWSSVCFDGRDTNPDDPDSLINFRSFHLASLRHFRVCHRNEGIWEISAVSGGRFHDALLENVIARFGALEFERMQSARASYIKDGPYLSDDPNDLGQISIDFGWRTHDGPPGYYLQVMCSNARSSVATRFRFITRAIEQLDAKDLVRVVGDEQSFALRAADGWSLYELEDVAGQLPRKDPRYFPLGPFSSFAEVWRRAERFRHTALDQPIDELWVGCTVTPEVYESLHEQLNGLANDWHVNLYGSYADGINPYSAEPSQSPNGRFPVFRWKPGRELGHLFYQADIVPAPEGRFLEIRSNCGDMKKLLKEAEAAVGVPFVPAAVND